MTEEKREKTLIEQCQQQMIEKWGNFFDQKLCRNREIAQKYQQCLSSSWTFHKMKDWKKLEEEIRTYMKHAPEWKMFQEMIRNASKKRVKTLEEEMEELQDQWNDLPVEQKLFAFSDHWITPPQSLSPFQTILDYYKKNPLLLRPLLDHWFLSILQWYHHDPFTMDYYRSIYSYSLITYGGLELDRIS